ncbi:hypothetical protein NECAME_05696 [Necator americanus]|uniref:Uncharacterized protein n=1 Tax=Necator americanus TaxID=51031 RepID=W2SF60_NECAM|nr:hypothetical protein NECAME_05696 [Necator americanus]ETN68215.1 hypothetical protein NECAME_05696 [Necator americanus]
MGESLIETNNGHRGEVISNEQAILNNTVQEDMPMSLNVTSVDSFSFNMLGILCSGFLLLSFFVLIYCSCSIHQSASNGKFLDTSYRLFNEQKVHKAMVDCVTNEVFRSALGPKTCSPARMVSAFVPLVIVTILIRLSS